MPNKKPRELRITKFYLLACVFGVMTLLCVYKDWYFAGAIMLLFTLAYSRADYMCPPIENEQSSSDDDDDTNSGLMV